MAQLTFGTKAETLLQLAEFDGSFVVPPLLFFTTAEWSDDRDCVLETIQGRFGTTPVAVRSSLIGEDGAHESQAGAFGSVLHVDAGDTEGLAAAIEEVVATYGPAIEASDQVLIQQMVTDVDVSGVIMTRMVDDGSPYYVFNYDDETNRTDSITGGTGAHKTVMVYRGASQEDCDSPRLRRMLAVTRELETISANGELDIEFALSESGDFSVLQLRRIAGTARWGSDTDLPVARRLPQLRQFLDDLSARRPGLYGESTILGNMPDWNPAEIIGVHPTPLAFSLYAHLVTSDTWRQARQAMGYRPMPRTELMVLVAGSPYVDVRASFNSFLPAGIDSDTGEKLVNAWLGRLADHPELHDKIEFDIVSTAHDLDFDTRFIAHYPDLLTPEQRSDYAALLRGLTAAAFDLSARGSLPLALAAIEALSAKQGNEVLRPDLESGPVSTAGWIAATLDDCINLGTLPFAIIARHAFIAESFLRSLARLGALSAERVQEFKASISTVLGDLAADAVAVSRDELSRAAFLERYGHLRPGTYDIMAVSYRERSDLFGSGADAIDSPSARDFEPTDQERSRIDKLFADHQYHHVDTSLFFDYARRAISGREYSKSIFTKSLSAVIDTIVEWGRFHGLGREELSLLRVGDITDTAFTLTRGEPTRTLTDKIDHARLDARSDRLVKMGYLIRDSRDLNVVPIHRSSPNFVTQQRVEGRVLLLETPSVVSPDLRGQIVCIENADPGFDWIFSLRPAGLITKYGGANSHMAVRCAELQLPASIGCGELIFASLIDGADIVLSCKDKTIRVL